MDFLDIKQINIFIFFSYSSDDLKSSDEFSIRSRSSINWKLKNGEENFEFCMR